MPRPTLNWLPDAPDFRARLQAIGADVDAAAPKRWADLVALANTRLDFLRTERLDEVLRRVFPIAPAGLADKPIRLALLSTSTTLHLVASIRIAALRRNLHVTLHEGDYGQYFQDLSDESSTLFKFEPDVVLLALDARSVTAGVDPTIDHERASQALDSIRAHYRRCWTLARERLGAAVIQQTVLPVFPSLLGANEQRLPGSSARMVARVNAALRGDADEAGVHLLALDEVAARDGIVEWHDPVSWFRAKQEVASPAGPFYGDLVGRLLAALRGRSAKCLVLDLDNTLWGGTIGDDGLEGIVLGPGSALGEACLALQGHARSLAQRGIILAVCSKNDEANAIAAFDEHPEMLLRRSEISCFVANWQDKASNLRDIAGTLNIGLESLVFLDDNPFERNLIRAELPEVAVPEIPGDDPAMMPGVLSDAGYFEGLAVTADDRSRTRQYRENSERATLEATATDMPTYLRSLDMRMVWQAFDGLGLARIVQLINKTNQFNLTTRRKTEAQVLALMDDPRAFGLQIRLIDRFGDNGMVAVVIGIVRDTTEGSICDIETWLMSCRVLGRGLELATLAVVVSRASALGATILRGEYIPTAKNGMVEQHYQKLGFTQFEHSPGGGHSARLSIDGFEPSETHMTIIDVAAERERRDL